MKNQKSPSPIPSARADFAAFIPAAHAPIPAPRYLIVAQPYSPVTMADCVSALQNEVNKHIACGASCVGGPFLLSGAICQAVLVP